MDIGTSRILDCCDWPLGAAALLTEPRELGGEVRENGGNLSGWSNPWPPAAALGGSTMFALRRFAQAPVGVFLPPVPPRAVGEK